ncbi:glycosyltransferase family 2 protein [Psychroserpens luteus]|uniref:Glycosyltransferase family 2 protein n=1 Tax=Psychroserpens luteus TaxID=1434066 RepID=A0ABW5ZWP0_9FLAO|nr:glycosyltransferase family 2 protein [Psychroserpens luteus]
MTTNKVSIIIPCYNALPFIKETLDCVFNQTYKNIEVIIVDDGSTDGTLEFLKTLSSPNLIVKPNSGKGACAARNYGFKLSSGAYLQFLDADDLLSLDKIEKQVNDLDLLSNHVSVCSTAHFYHEPEHGIITDHDFLYSTESPKDFLINLYGANGKDYNMVQTSAWLTPRAVIEKAGLWDETLSKDQDGEFFCRVVVNAQGVSYQPEVKNYYRKHVAGENIANQKQRRHLESQFRAIESKLNQLKILENTVAYKNAFALQYKLLAIDAYPEFKDIYKMAITNSKALGGSSYEPVLGGNIIEIVKVTFGWKKAKIFKLFLHQIKDLIKSK